MELVRSFIRSNYRLLNVEHVEIDERGQRRCSLQSMSGVVEDGRLVRAWGTQRDVTAEQESREELSRSEEKFRSIVRDCAGALLVHTGEYFLYANSAAEELLGYTLDDLRQSTGAPSVKKVFKEIQHLDAQPMRRELQIVTKQGIERWIDVVTASTILDGEPVSISAAFDITERKRAACLSELRNRIANLSTADHADDAFYKEIHGLLRDAIPAKCLSLALKESSGKLSVVYGTDEYAGKDRYRNGQRGLLEYVLRSGKSLLCTQQVQKELQVQGEIDGRAMAAKVWLGVPLSVENAVVGVLAIHDATNPVRYGSEHVRMLEAVAAPIAEVIVHRKREQSRYDGTDQSREFEDDNPFGIFLALGDGVVVQCNRTFALALGYVEPAEVVRARINIMGSSVRRQQALLKILHKSDVHCEPKLELIGASNRSYAVKASFAAVQDSNGAVIRIMGSIVPKQ
jgi:PAS domain S-box-containing protein